MNWLIPKDSWMTIDTYGTKIWRNKKGEYHKRKGPAIECANGKKCYYLYGCRHNVNGPAIDRPNGYKEWWLNGKVCLSERQWKRERNELVNT